jgi:hypothetical protein
MMSDISRSYSMSVVSLMSDMYLDERCDGDHTTNVHYVRFVSLTSVANSGIIRSIKTSKDGKSHDTPDKQDLTSTRNSAIITDISKTSTSRERRLI